MLFLGGPGVSVVPAGAGGVDPVCCGWAWGAGVCCFASFLLDLSPQAMPPGNEVVVARLAKQTNSAVPCVVLPPVPRPLTTHTAHADPPKPVSRKPVSRRIWFQQS